MGFNPIRGSSKTIITPVEFLLTYLPWMKHDAHEASNNQKEYRPQAEEVLISPPRVWLTRRPVRHNAARKKWTLVYAIKIQKNESIEILIQIKLTSLFIQSNKNKNNVLCSLNSHWILTWYDWLDVGSTSASKRFDPMLASGWAIVFDAGPT